MLVKKCAVVGPWPREQIIQQRTKAQVPCQHTVQLVLLVDPCFSPPPNVQACERNRTAGFGKLQSETALHPIAIGSAGAQAVGPKSGGWDAGAHSCVEFSKKNPPGLVQSKSSSAKFELNFNSKSRIILIQVRKSKRQLVFSSATYSNRISWDTNPYAVCPFFLSIWMHV